MRYLSVVTGLLALAIELLALLSLMELPPFGKGGSDLIWGLPFVGLVVFVLAIPGLAFSIGIRRRPGGDRRWANAGLVLNGLSLALPILAILFGLCRVLF